MEETSNYSPSKFTKFAESTSTSQMSRTDKVTTKGKTMNSQALTSIIRGLNTTVGGTTQAASGDYTI